MMRGFRIWPQNSNWITFDPFLAKKLLNLGIFGKISRKSLDSTVFGQKGGLMLSDLNFAGGQIQNPLRIRNSIYFRPPFDIFSDFDFLTSPCNFQNWKNARSRLFVGFLGKILPDIVFSRTGTMKYRGRLLILE